MLFRFIRRLKNRAVKQKRQPQEVIETDLNWIWQPFENSSTLQFSATVKKIAAAIIGSSADDIPTITFELDPRLVIPLCAIQMQDEINLTQLSSFKNELESVSIKDLYGQKEFIDRVLIKITPKERWRYLFESLTPQLQFALLSRLIDYRRPHQNDWRNIFEKIEYEFKKSPEYLGVLTVVFLLSLGSVIEIFDILSQPKSWVNGLMLLAILVVWRFVIVLWREFKSKEEKSEPTLLIKLGLLGPWTFYREWQRLLRKNLVWEGVTALSEPNFVVSCFEMALMSTGSMAMFEKASAGAGGIFGALFLAWAVLMFLSGAMTRAMTGAVGLFGASFWALALALFVAGALAEAVAVAVALALVGVQAQAQAKAGALVAVLDVFVAVFAAVFAARAGAGAGAGAAVDGIVLVVIDVGLSIWEEMEEDLRAIQFLSILAFPWFCWFPIVFGFTSFALYHRLSWEWQSISLFWLVIFGFCTVLWVRGKKLEEKARNPLRGILDGQ